MFNNEPRNRRSWFGVLTNKQQPTTGANGSSSNSESSKPAISNPIEPAVTVTKTPEPDIVNHNPLQAGPPPPAYAMFASSQPLTVALKAQTSANLTRAGQQTDPKSGPDHSLDPKDPESKDCNSSAGKESAKEGQSIWQRAASLRRSLGKSNQKKQRDKDKESARERAKEQR